MRAVVHDRYGPPEVLRVADVERPVPKDDEVLVRVHASTVTRSDAMRVRSVEYRFTRVITGIRRPRKTHAGMEFAGRVEAVGAAVTDSAPATSLRHRQRCAGRVRRGARSAAIAPKPAGLTYEEAAAVPDGSLLALTCLRPAGALAGKRVLVYGAAGSVGTAAVQLLAHHLEADVSAVCDTKDVELVRSLGAREVLDRLREDFAPDRPDLRRDLRRGRKLSFRRCRAALAPAASTSRWTSASCTTSRCSAS